jgi:hypothetical protein
VVFLLLPRRWGVALGAVAWLARAYAVASTVSRVWMLSGLGWVVVMAFYALTALWLVLLPLLWRGNGRTLAVWMIPLAAVEAAGAVLGARLDARSLSAVASGVMQVYFLLRTARTS